METIRRAYAPFVVPAECREAFAREEHRHNCQVGVGLSLATLLVGVFLLLVRYVDIPQGLSTILSVWPVVPILAAVCGLSLAAMTALLLLRRREQVDAPLASAIMLAYVCLMMGLMVYQSHHEIPTFGVENINVIALAMIIAALMMHFPLHITLLLESGILATALVALFLDRPYISNFYPSLVDLVGVYILISLAAARNWRLRIRSFAGTRRLSNIANVDSLTQIQNRRGFDEALPQVWQRMENAELPLSLLMIDVDFFKKFNDAYGHQAGDECLKKVAEALSASVRALDFVGRYGGEEFVVLLPGAGLSAARRVGARMAQEMASHAVPHEGNTASPFVTFSIGCACCRSGITCETPEALVRMADEALYMAKKEGRNRLVAHPDSAE